MAFDCSEKINENATPDGLAAFGSELKKARRLRRMSQREVAEVTGLDIATIQSLERGRGTVGPLVTLLAILEHRFVEQPADEPLGRWIAKSRKDAGYTQAALADMIGVSKPTIVQIEHGRGKVDGLLGAIVALGIKPQIKWIGVHHERCAGPRFASLCSGIEGVSQAWQPLGFHPVFFAEKAPFPSAVLAHRYPDVPNLGDITRLDGRPWRGQIDVLWASTPCTSFSVAGNRRGTADEAGGLIHHFSRIADEIDPAFLVWENVKGVLSDEENAFGDLLAALVGEDGPLQPAGPRWTNAGYVLGPDRAVAWRVLDSQYSGLAQRRERLFLVGCPRNGADPREILFEQSRQGRHRAPVRTQRHDNPSQAGKGAIYVNSDALPKVGMDIAHTLKADSGSGGRACVLDGERVRRLTPRECERLMGLKPDTTLITWRGRPVPDTLRWKAIGNSVATPDVRWIGEKILAHSGCGQPNFDPCTLQS